ncbi:protein FAM149A isoform X2 [Xyrauchen texanus]|uniref:protein FAM149A isoform X2 n=1 Tax=Xyrauchen texanus TaxID=154827 RepID=UPI0022429B45|nr:protein FAM149A isoform X2 [Xyrauchen texanus]
MHSALCFGRASSFATLPPVLAYYPNSCIAEYRNTDVGLVVIGKKLLQEPVKSISSVPAPFTRSVSRVPTSDLSISSCGQSSAVGANPVSHLPFCSDNPGTDPSPSTEHSSIYSWRYDEFERVNTQHVHRLFNSVDELLYEGRVSSSESLQEECEEWNRHTPHLRILGNQLEPPKQEGVQYICRRESSTRTSLFPSPLCLDKREDHSVLFVEGHSLARGLWSEPSVLSSCSPLPELSLCLTEEEEVYETEGNIEEFLAYDGKEMEDEDVGQRKSSNVIPRCGVPPVSPQACIRDAVADELFDDVWRVVVGLLEELLHKYWEKQFPDGKTHRRTLESSSQEPSSQDPVKGHHILLSRGSSSRSTFLSTCSNNVQDSSALKINLNGVMTIQAKPLQKRYQGFGEKALFVPEDGATMLMCVKSQALRGSCVLTQKPAAQRRLPIPSGRVRMYHNLTGNGSQLLRGTRLSTVKESLPSPPVSAIQNHRLPHIHSKSPEQEFCVPVSRLVQLRVRTLRGGASSSMHPVNNLPPLREPMLTLESRPNTTHTYRSDTPMKRSFTPLDYACNMRTGRTPGKASGFLECATPSRRHIPISTCADGDRGNMPLLNSLGGQSHRKKLSRFPVHARKKFQPVMP